MAWRRSGVAVSWVHPCMHSFIHAFSQPFNPLSHLPCRLAHHLACDLAHLLLARAAELVLFLLSEGLFMVKGLGWVRLFKTIFFENQPKCLFYYK